MKSSDLNLYFSNSISIKDFIGSFKTEVDNYIALKSKKGASSPVYFDDSQPVLVDSSMLYKLITDLRHHDYDFAVLNYICDGLTLGEKVEYSNPWVKEITFDLADSEISSFSDEIIETILKLLETF